MTRIYFGTGVDFKLTILTLETGWAVTGVKAFASVMADTIVAAGFVVGAVVEILIAV